MFGPDPSAYPSRRMVRIILVLGCVTGLSTYIVTPLEQPNQLMLASDVYRYATQSWLSGEGLYGVYPPDRPGYAVLYPPIAVLVFLPHALLPSDLIAYAFQTLLNLGAALGTALVVYRALLRRKVDVERVDLILLGLFMILSSYSAIQFMNGQINLWLALAIAIGFEAADRNRSALAGVAFALAALFKVFPAVLGLWLLRNRKYRAVGVAVATGVGGVVLGALVFGPELTMTYLSDVLLGRFEGSTYDGRPDPSDNVDGIHRQLAAVFPGGGMAHTLIALVILVPMVAIAMFDVRSRFHRDVAGLAVIVGILLFLPLQPLYFPLIVFPLVMLLYTLPRGRERRLLTFGTILTFVHLDPASIEIGFRVIPAPEVVVNTVLAASATVSTFILPPTAGLWILLFTCVLLQLPEISVDGPGKLPTPS